MNQERKLSFFLPPISPVKDANGKNVTPATLVPHKELTLEEVWNIVTGSPRLKKLTEAAAAAYGDEKEYRRLKQSTLPYVTPCGTFSYRRSDRLLAPSGLSWTWTIWTAARRPKGCAGSCSTTLSCCPNWCS